MSDKEPQEADRAEGAPHPRHTPVLYGQTTAEAEFLNAYQTGRLHHGWLIAGPRGVGKATLAWRLARFLLTRPPEGGMFAEEPPESLEPPEDHPVLARMEALSEPGLCLIRRAWDEKKERLRQEITVDEVRRLKTYFELSATDGGRRVAIIDCADELNRNAANAVLKLLEEPPARTTLFLISHQPSRLLPTIRSRCRTLRCAALAPGDLAQALAQAGAEAGPDAPALSALAGGSVGTALRLINEEGLTLYQTLATLAADPNARSAAIKLADSTVGAKNAARLDLVLDLLDLFLTRVARTGMMGPPAPEAFDGEAALLARIAPSSHAARQWADLAQSLSDRARHGRAVNIDPGALILDLCLKIQAQSGFFATAPA